MTLAKMAVIFLALCSCIHFGCAFVSNRIYHAAQVQLVNQRNICRQDALKKELLNDEGDLTYCITQMKNEMISGKQPRKQFHACLSHTDIIERSCTINERVKKSAIQPHELYSYKLSGTLDAIDQLFSQMKEMQSGLFCKTIVVTREAGDQYCLNLVFKEYMQQKK